MASPVGLMKTRDAAPNTATVGRPMSIADAVVRLRMASVTAGLKMGAVVEGPMDNLALLGHVVLRTDTVAMDKTGAAKAVNLNSGHAMDLASAAVCSILTVPRVIVVRNGDTVGILPSTAAKDVSRHLERVEIRLQALLQ